MSKFWQHNAAHYSQAAGGIVAVTALLELFHGSLSTTTVALALLLIILFIATFLGRNPALLAAGVAMLCFNYFFLPPYRTLLAASWGGNYTEQTEYLRVFIGQLRKKIEADPSHPHYILTEPWVGYRFLPDASL